MATTPEPDPFQLLGVSEDASDEAINDAWRRRMKRCHPDFARGEADRQRRLAESVALNRAHDVLMDPDLKEAAIRARHAWTPGGSEPPGAASSTERPADRPAPAWADGVWDGTRWSRSRWRRPGPPADDPLPEGASTVVRVFHIVRWVVRWAVWQVICLFVPSHVPGDSDDP